MNLQNKSAQHPEQNNTPKLTPDFSHRLSTLGNGAEAHLLAEAVSDSCSQAESALGLVSCFFTGETESMPSDELIYWTLHSVVQTIKDIDAMVSAYHDANQQA